MAFGKKKNKIDRLETNATNNRIFAAQSIKKYERKAEDTSKVTEEEIRDSILGELERKRRRVGKIIDAVQSEIAKGDNPFYTEELLNGLWTYYGELNREFSIAEAEYKLGRELALGAVNPVKTTLKTLKSIEKEAKAANSFKWVKKNKRDLVKKQTTMYRNEAENVVNAVLGYDANAKNHIIDNMTKDEIAKKIKEAQVKLMENQEQQRNEEFWSV